VLVVSPPHFGNCPDAIVVPISCMPSLFAFCPHSFELPKFCNNLSFLPFLPIYVPDLMLPLLVLNPHAHLMLFGNPQLLKILINYLFIF